jgi:hypothetical protein
MKQPAHMTPEERAAWYASLPKKPPWPLLDQERLDYYNTLVVAALRHAGVQVNSISDLVKTNEPYPEAIPTLLHLARTFGNSCREERAIHKEIIRCLTVPEAKGVGADVLLPVFKRDAAGDPSFGWQVANALSVVAEARHFDEILGLIHDERYGNARAPLPEALRGPRDRVISILRPLLGVVPFQSSTIDAARQLHLVELRDEIAQVYRNYPSAETRRHAVAVVKALDKATAKAGRRRTQG